MSHLAKVQYLIAIWDRYQKTSKKEKGRILDEFCAVCGYSRKSAIRLLNSSISPGNVCHRGRKPHYNQKAILALRDIWHLTGRVCAKRLKEAMSEWLEFYLRRPKEISASTIDRKLQTLELIVLDLYSLIR